MDKQILNFLSENDETEVPTLKIAKHIGGPKASVKSSGVNRILYQMQKDGILEKLCEENGGKPRWKIISNE